MAQDFYCDEVLSGRTPIEKVFETENVLAYYHTRPFWPVHIVVIPKKHIESLITVEGEDENILTELFSVIKRMATHVTAGHGSCQVLTNVGEYQENKHLHVHVIFGEKMR
jgi:histidine triad (HIT) family protein